MPRADSMRTTSRVASLSESPLARLKETVTDGNKPVWLIWRGPRLSKDDDEDSTRAIHVARGPDVLRGVRYVGDVGKSNGFAIVVGDDQRLVLVS